MGYSVSHSEGTVLLRGEPEEKKLREIKSNFYHLSNAIQNPIGTIYQQLDVNIPDRAIVMRHSSGVYDNRFITFQLHQIVMENQQSSLVLHSLSLPFPLWLSPVCFQKGKQNHIGSQFRAFPQFPSSWNVEKTLVWPIILNRDGIR